MFERGVVLFGKDSRVSGVVTVTPVSKVHQVEFLEIEEREVMFVGTEDGRVCVYGIDTADAPSNEDAAENWNVETDKDPLSLSQPSTPVLLATIGGRKAGVASRIKDFGLLSYPDTTIRYLTTAGSDGIIRVYTLDFALLFASLNNGKIIETPKKKQKVLENGNGGQDGDAKGQEGVSKRDNESFAELIGVFDTGRRITCLKIAELEDDGPVPVIKEEDEEGEEWEDEDEDSNVDDEEEDDEDMDEDNEDEIDED